MVGAGDDYDDDDDSIICSCKLRKREYGVLSTYGGYSGAR